jgi:broad specificity phosphatase PhoE
VWFTDIVLFLVRHGRTAANARGLLQGRLDPPLDEVGHQQAEAIAAMVGPVDEVVCSPLARARETAVYFGHEPRVDERWIELAYGEYEGMPTEEVPPAIWQAWRENSEFRTKGGESFGDLDARVRAACVELQPRMHESRIVVVSHVSPIKSAVAWALGVTMEIMFHCHLSQASLCRLDNGRFGPVLHSFNEQART